MSTMNALKNATHGAVLFLWAIAGLIFTFKMLSLGTLLPVVFFCIWLAGYGGFTTWLVAQFKSAPAALLAHAGTIFGLMLVPRVMPLSLLRYGLDVLF